MYPQYQIPTQQNAWKKYIVPLMIVVHIATFSVCVTSGGFPSQSFVHLIIGMLFSCTATVLTILYAKSNIPKFISMFLVATCTCKLPLCLLTPEQTFLPFTGLEGKQLAIVTVERFFYLSIGVMGFALGSIAASRVFWNLTDVQKREQHFSLPEKGFGLILILYLAIQSMRAFLLLVLQIGAPSVITRELFIPKLAGILNILGTRGLLLVTSGLLAWALSRKSYGALFVSILAALTYAFVEVAGGWRSGMFYYALCGSWVFLAAEPSKLKSRLKPFAIGFVVLAFVMFMPVMEYRNRLRQGMTPGQAIQAVLELRQDDESTFLDRIHPIARRFNGLDLFVLASYGSRNVEMGFMSLITGSASQFFTYGLLQVPEEAVSTSGITYWGSMAIALGDRSLGFMGLLLGMFIGGFPMICRHWFYSPMMRTLFECNITITFLHLTMGNGAFLLYAKEVFILLIVAFVFRFLATTQGSPGYYSHSPSHYPSH